jgi:hypothetical protein
MADSKIKHTAGAKQRTEHTYNPLGLQPTFNQGDQVSVNTSVNQTVNQSAVMAEAPVNLVQPQQSADPFGFDQSMMTEQTVPAVQQQNVAAPQ